jgi:hypothetical protein
MATTMKVTLKADVSGASTTSATHTLSNIEAFDKIDVTVPASDNIEVEVQPGGSGQVQLLFITAGNYSDNLTYTVTGGESDVALNAPQMFVGTGAVGLLGNTQNTITFTNGESSDIDVQVLVGRDATAAP